MTYGDIISNKVNYRVVTELASLALVESSSPVSVLFREMFSHLYIFFFHLLVNGFSLTCQIVQ